MIDNGFKKCGSRLLNTLTEHYQVNWKAFSLMLADVTLNTDLTDYNSLPTTLKQFLLIKSLSKTQIVHLLLQNNQLNSENRIMNDDLGPTNKTQFYDRFSRSTF